MRYTLTEIQMASKKFAEQGKFRDFSEFLLYGDWQDRNNLNLQISYEKEGKHMENALLWWDECVGDDERARVIINAYEENNFKKVSP